MSIPLAMHSFAEISAGMLLNGLVLGLALAIGAHLALRLAKPQASATRFAILLSTLIAVTAIPILFSGLISGYSSAVAHSRRAVMLPGSWAEVIFVTWAVIASVALLRVGMGAWHLLRMRRQCTPLDPETLDPILRRTISEFQTHRSVALCSTQAVRMPVAIGLASPAIVVFPNWTLEEMSASELNSILIHELAHLRRCDDWTNLFQKVVGALLFFHPAIWWLNTRLALEREMCCDELVLRQTSSPRAYAECLVMLTEKALQRRELNLVQAAISRVRETSLRVMRILENRSSNGRAWTPATAIASALLVAGFGASTQMPALVGFAHPATVAHAAAVSVQDHHDAMFVPAGFHPETKSMPQVEATTPKAIPAVFNPDSVPIRSQRRMGHRKTLKKSVAELDSAMQALRGDGPYLRNISFRQDDAQLSPGNVSEHKAVLVFMQATQYGPTMTVFTVQFYEVSPPGAVTQSVANSPSRKI